MEQTRKPGKLCRLIQRKYPGLSLEEAFDIIGKVKKENGGTIIGLKMETFFNLVKQVIREESMKEEKKAKKEIEDQRRLNKTCPFCFIVFVEKFSKDRHVRLVHSEKPEKQNESKHMDDESFEKCTECGKVYRHKISLKRHMKVHKDAPDSFDCDLCNKKFTRNDSLFKHRERVHHLWNVNLEAVRKKFKNKLICPMCSDDFGTDNNKFELHLVSKACKDKDKIVEIDENDKFKCDLCDRSYSDMNSLQNHIRWKHNNSTRDFKCSFCEASFSYKSSLVRHIRKSHNDTQE